MPDVELTIAGRSYRVACRTGEEQQLRRAAELVDSRSRQALAGLGAMSEARQMLLAALLIADEALDKGISPMTSPDPVLLSRVEALATRLESLAEALEKAQPA